MKDRKMSRWEAIKRLEEGAPFSKLYDSHWEDALALAIKALKAEPVVRCKDCQYRGSTAECLERDDDWFCADGKRREDAEKTN